MTDATIPAPPPTEPSNPVPCRDDVLSVEWRGRTLLIPRKGRNFWFRRVCVIAGSAGFLAVARWPEDNMVIVEVEFTRTTMTRRITTTNRARAELGTSIADLLTDACEGIDRIPDEFWELMAAPLEGETA